jgi:hypothetical protein
MSPSYLLFVLIGLVCVISSVYGDDYMQHPRGNNNRFRETSADRQNANRLFDSQNNARGGYCWGPPLTYYEGSILAVEWTTQHACGNSNTKCNLILQYMCSYDGEGADETQIIRDGTTTNTITTNTDPTSPDYYNQRLNDIESDLNGEFKYGMNEPYENYFMCTRRDRNKGLWVAGEQPGTSAMNTRQNTNGDRFGFECTEERDYYPYWHPSPWKDIVVFADDKDDCDYYQKESQNVKAKHFCNGTTDAQLKPNNEADCTRANGNWIAKAPWGIGKPQCKKAPWGRDNHLGNSFDGHTSSYNWTLPRTSQEECIKKGSCACVLRMRYNITIGELSGKEDWRNNKENGPIQRGPDNNNKIYKEYEGMNFTITIDGQETGRVFQDRSFMFRIASRPNGVPKDATIYNLNVRGKRGNIVQTYPATEYDFVPTFLEVTQGDYVHFQWTGCDFNPAGNAGQGRQSTDRSNIVQISDMSRNFPLNETEIKKHKLLFKDDELRRRMAMIDQEDCLTYEQLKQQQTEDGTAIEQNPQNCMLLNSAGPRFTGALVKMTDVGSYAYMSTRNNNFSNRSQKGQITVKSSWKPWMTAVIVVGGVAAIGIGAAVGTLVYVRKHPLSRAAEVVHKIPGLSKV